jgi:hypothetical protein
MKLVKGVRIPGVLEQAGEGVYRQLLLDEELILQKWVGGHVLIVDVVVNEKLLSSAAIVLLARGVFLSSCIKGVLSVDWLELALAVLRIFGLVLTSICHGV